MCIRILFVVLIGTTLLCGGQAFATITYGFISSSTGFQGQITIDENHASFSPGSTISLGGAITDFVFTYEDNGGLNTYTPSDLEIVQLALQFSASGVAPDDIVFAQGSYRDTALPQGGNIRFEFGGISSGGSTATNGNFTGASTGNLSFNDGTFTPGPCEYLLAGDMNNDCRVDFLDFVVFAMNWLVDCFQTPGDPACVPK